MVLRKERLSKVGTSTSTSTVTMSNEQPVTKRQRIDNRNGGNIDNEDNTDSVEKLLEISETIDNDLDEKKEITKIENSNVISTSSTIPSNKFSNNNSLASNSPTISQNSSTDEVDKCILDISNQTTSTSSTSNLLRKNVSTVTTANCNKVNGGSEMAEFEEFLIKQCLCGVSERTLRKPFESHYSHDINGCKRIANLCEWPTNKLLQFLSNLQLLFDIYLKQNSKGFICSRIMDICDALIRNDHNLIDEIIELANFNNKYVQFLSGRVLASFLVIAKNNMDDNWLKNLVNNLFVFERMDFVAIRKMHFSLEIIKRIVEWKDIDIHPLEDEMDTRTSSLENQLHHPTLENNYFAVHFNSEMVEESSNSSISSSNSIKNSTNNTLNNVNAQNNSKFTVNKTGSEAVDCHLITLNDSESFDTTHLKCVTIKILENKWPALVKNMSNLISTYRDVTNAENCILTFLCLWENIISVKANLSIVETLPFYAQLDKFELLLNQDLSCTVYKQMLKLFNEALCYGSTLALQDLLPEETCMLAHQIVRHVKDFRILDSLPRRQPENIVSLVGYKGATISYENGSIHRKIKSHLVNNNELIELNEIPDMDKVILQKIVLLVLKSVAVTVKEIRSDSSDSSIDSTDYDAFQDMVLIERSIRDVLKKLESFIKNTLEFHPECHFSKILIHLFDDQDDHLIEAMVCTLDVTAGISFRNNAFPELVAMLNPVLTFLEFLKMISNSSELLLDLLVSNETCFLLYLLRFLKYIRLNWSMFVTSCQNFGVINTVNVLDDAMTVLIRLRLQISRLVSKQLYPYDISPVLRLLESCENLYEGNELS